MANENNYESSVKFNLDVDLTDAEKKMNAFIRKHGSEEIELDIDINIEELMRSIKTIERTLSKAFLKVDDKGKLSSVFDGMVQSLEKLGNCIKEVNTEDGLESLFKIDMPSDFTKTLNSTTVAMQKALTSFEEMSNNRFSFNAMRDELEGVNNALGEIRKTLGLIENLEGWKNLAPPDSYLPEKNRIQKEVDEAVSALNAMKRLEKALSKTRKSQKSKMNEDEFQETNQYARYRKSFDKLLDKQTWEKGGKSLSSHLSIIRDFLGDVSKLSNEADLSKLMFPQMGKGDTKREAESVISYIEKLEGVLNLLKKDSKGIDLSEKFKMSNDARATYQEMLDFLSKIEKFRGNPNLPTILEQIEEANRKMNEVDDKIRKTSFKQNNAGLKVNLEEGSIKKIGDELGKIIRLYDDIDKRELKIDKSSFVDLKKLLQELVEQFQKVEISLSEISANLEKGIKINYITDEITEATGALAEFDDRLKDLGFNKKQLKEFNGLSAIRKGIEKGTMDIETGVSRARDLIFKQLSENGQAVKIEQTYKGIVEKTKELAKQLVPDINLDEYDKLFVRLEKGLVSSFDVINTIVKSNEKTMSIPLEVFAKEEVDQIQKNMTSLTNKLKGFKELFLNFDKELADGFAFKAFEAQVESMVATVTDKLNTIVKSFRTITKIIVGQEEEIGLANAVKTVNEKLNENLKEFVTLLGSYTEEIENLNKVAGEFMKDGSTRFHISASEEFVDFKKTMDGISESTKAMYKSLSELTKLLDKQSNMKNTDLFGDELLEKSKRITSAFREAAEAIPKSSKDQLKKVEGLFDAYTNYEVFATDALRKMDELVGVKKKFTASIKKDGTDNDAMVVARSIYENIKVALGNSKSTEEEIKAARANLEELSKYYTDIQLVFKEAGKSEFIDIQTQAGWEKIIALAKDAKGAFAELESAILIADPEKIPAFKAIGNLRQELKLLDGYNIDFLHVEEDPDAIAEALMKFYDAVQKIEKVRPDTTIEGFDDIVAKLKSGTLDVEKAIKRIQDGFVGVQLDTSPIKNYSGELERFKIILNEFYRYVDPKKYNDLVSGIVNDGMDVSKAISILRDRIKGSPDIDISEKIDEDKLVAKLSGVINKIDTKDLLAMNVDQTLKDIDVVINKLAKFKTKNIFKLNKEELVNDLDEIIGKVKIINIPKILYDNYSPQTTSSSVVEEKVDTTLNTTTETETPKRRGRKSKSTQKTTPVKKETVEREIKVRIVGIEEAESQILGINKKVEEMPDKKIDISVKDLNDFKTDIDIASEYLNDSIADTTVKLDVLATIDVVEKLERIRSLIDSIPSEKNIKLLFANVAEVKADLEFFKNHLSLIKGKHQAEFEIVKQDEFLKQVQDIEESLDKVVGKDHSVEVKAKPVLSDEKSDFASDLESIQSDAYKNTVAVVKNSILEIQQSINTIANELKESLSNSSKDIPISFSETSITTELNGLKEKIASAFKSIPVSTNLSFEDVIISEQVLAKIDEKIKKNIEFRADKDYVKKITTSINNAISTKEIHKVPLLGNKNHLKSLTSNINKIFDKVYKIKLELELGDLKAEAKKIGKQIEAKAAEVNVGVDGTKSSAKKTKKNLPPLNKQVQTLGEQIQKNFENIRIGLSKDANEVIKNSLITQLNSIPMSVSEDSIKTAGSLIKTSLSEDITNLPFSIDEDALKDEAKKVKTFLSNETTDIPIAINENSITTQGRKIKDKFEEKLKKVSIGVDPRSLNNEINFINKGFSEGIKPLQIEIDANKARTEAEFLNGVLISEVSEIPVFIKNTNITNEAKKVKKGLEDSLKNIAFNIEPHSINSELDFVNTAFQMGIKPIQIEIDENKATSEAQYLNAIFNAESKDVIIDLDGLKNNITEAIKELKAGVEEINNIKVESSIVPEGTATTLKELDGLQLKNLSSIATKIKKLGEGFAAFPKTIPNLDEIGKLIKAISENSISSTTVSSLNALDVGNLERLCSLRPIANGEDFEGILSSIVEELNKIEGALKKVPPELIHIDRDSVKLLETLADNVEYLSDTFDDVEDINKISETLNALSVALKNIPNKIPDFGAIGKLAKILSEYEIKPSNIESLNKLNPDQLEKICKLTTPINIDGNEQSILTLLKNIAIEFHEISDIFGDGTTSINIEVKTDSLDKITTLADELERIRKALDGYDDKARNTATVLTELAKSMQELQRVSHGTIIATEVDEAIEQGKIPATTTAPTATPERAKREEKNREKRQYARTKSVMSTLIESDVRKQEEKQRDSERQDQSPKGSYSKAPRRYIGTRLDRSRMRFHNKPTLGEVKNILNMYDLSSEEGIVGLAEYYKATLMDIQNNALKMRNGKNFTSGSVLSLNNLTKRKNTIEYALEKVMSREGLKIGKDKYVHAPRTLTEYEVAEMFQSMREAAEVNKNINKDLENLRRTVNTYKDAISTASKEGYEEDSQRTLELLEGDIIDTLDRLEEQEIRDEDAKNSQAFSKDGKDLRDKLRKQFLSLYKARKGDEQKKLYPFIPEELYEATPDYSDFDIVERLEELYDGYSNEYYKYDEKVRSGIYTANDVKAKDKAAKAMSNIRQFIADRADETAYASPDFSMNLVNLLDDVIPHKDYKRENLKRVNNDKDAFEKLISNFKEKVSTVLSEGYSEDGVESLIDSFSKVQGKLNTLGEYTERGLMSNAEYTKAFNDYIDLQRELVKNFEDIYSSNKEVYDQLAPQKSSIETTKEFEEEVEKLNTSLASLHDTLERMRNANSVQDIFEIYFKDFDEENNAVSSFIDKLVNNKGEIDSKYKDEYGSLSTDELFERYENALYDLSKAQERINKGDKGTDAANRLKKIQQRLADIIAQIDRRIQVGGLNEEDVFKLKGDIDDKYTTPKDADKLLEKLRTQIDDYKRLLTSSESGSYTNSQIKDIMHSFITIIGTKQAANKTELSEEQSTLLDSLIKEFEESNEIISKNAQGIYDSYQLIYEGLSAKKGDSSNYTSKFGEAVDELGQKLLTLKTILDKFGDDDSKQEIGSWLNQFKEAEKAVSSLTSKIINSNGDIKNEFLDTLSGLSDDELYDKYRGASYDYYTSQAKIDGGDTTRGVVNSRNASKKLMESIRAQLQKRVDSGLIDLTTNNARLSGIGIDASNQPIITKSLEQYKQAVNDLKTAIKNYIASGFNDEEFLEPIRKAHSEVLALEATLNSIARNKDTIAYSKGLSSKQETKFNDIHKTRDSILSSYVNKSSKDIPEYMNQLNFLQSNADGKFAQYSIHVSTLSKTISELNALKFTNDMGADEIANAIKQYDELDDKVKELLNLLTSGKNKIKDKWTSGLGIIGIADNANAALEEMMSHAKNVAGGTNITQTATNDYAKLTYTIAGVGNVVENVTLEWDELNNTIRKTSVTTTETVNKVGGMLKAVMNRVSKAATYWFAMYLDPMDLVFKGQQVFQTINALDDAMIELQKTTTASMVQVQKFYHEANEIAKEYGSTTEEIIRQTADWSRSGYSLNESVEMAKLSSQFATISDGMAVEDATNSLISTMKAFGFTTDEVLDGIMSKVNAVGNSFAVSNADIAEGLRVASAAMKASGSTFEETIALFTGANEIIHDASSVANGLRTVSMRMRGYDEETEEVSEEYSNIKGEIADLTDGKVSIMKDADTYRSLIDVMGQIAELVNSGQLTDKQTAALYEKMFGKTRMQVGSAIISNWDSVEASMGVMQDSKGSADRELKTAQDSISFSLNAVKETWTGLWQKMFPTDDVKNVISILQVLSDVITGLVGTMGKFGVVATSWLTVSVLRRYEQFMSTFREIGKYRDRISDIGKIFKPKGLSTEGTITNTQAVDINKTLSRNPVMKLEEKATVLERMGFTQEEAHRILTANDEMNSLTTYSHDDIKRTRNRLGYNDDYRGSVKDTFTQKMLHDMTGMDDKKLLISNSLLGDYGFDAREFGKETVDDMIEHIERLKTASDETKRISDEQAEFLKNWVKGLEGADIPLTGVTDRVNVLGRAMNGMKDIGKGVVNFFANFLTNVTNLVASLSTLEKALLAVFIASMLFKGAVALWNSGRETFNELAESANNAIDKYEETKAELDEVKKSLSETKDKIYELEATPNLTIVQENELTKLKQTKSQLESMVELKQKLADIELRESLTAADKAIGSNYYKEGFLGIEYGGNSTKTEDLVNFYNELKEAYANRDAYYEEAGSIASNYNLEDEVLYEGLSEDKKKKKHPVYSSAEEFAKKNKTIEDLKDKIDTTIGEVGDYLALAEYNIDEDGKIINESYQKNIESINLLRALIPGMNTDSVNEQMSTMLEMVSGSVLNKEAASAAQSLLSMSESDFYSTDNLSNFRKWTKTVQNYVNGITDGELLFTIRDFEVAFMPNKETRKEVYNNFTDSVESALTSADKKVYENESFNGKKVDVSDPVTPLGVSGNEAILEMMGTVGEYATNDQLKTITLDIETDPSKFKKAIKNYKSFEKLFSDLNKANGKMTDNFVQRAYKLGINLEEVSQHYGSLLVDGGKVFTDYLAGTFEYVDDMANRYVGITKDTADTIARDFADMYKDESWQEANSDLVNLAKQSIVTATDVEELAKTDDRLAAILSQQGMTAQFAASCLNELGAGGSVFKILTADALNLNLVLNSMADNFTNLSNAKSKYDATMQADDYNANFQSVAGAYDDIMSAFEKGEYGKKFWAGAEYLLGEESFAMSVDEVYKAVSKLDGVFDDVESNGFGLLGKLSKLDLSGLNTEVTKNKDGSYDWFVDAEEVDQLAQKAGMSSAAMSAAIQALQMYEGTFSFKPEMLEKAIQNMSISFENGEGKNVLSSSALKNQLSILGYEGKEVYDIMSAVSEMESIKLLDFSNAEANNVVDVLNELDKVSIITDTINGEDKQITDLNNFVIQLKEGFNLTNDEVIAFTDNIKNNGYVLKSTTGESVEEILKQYEAVGNLSEHYSSVQTKVSELDKLIDGVDSKEMKGVLEVNSDKYKEAIEEAVNAQKLIPEKITTMLTFDLDRAELQKKIEEGRKLLNAGATGEQRQQLRTEGIAYSTQITEDTFKKMGFYDENGNLKSGATALGKDSVWGKTEEEKQKDITEGINATTDADKEIYQTAAYNKALNLQNLSLKFEELNPDFDMDSDIKDVNKAFLSLQNTLSTLQINPIEMNEGDFLNSLSNFETLYTQTRDRLEKRGIKISANGSEIYSDLNEAIAYCQEHDISVDINTEQGLRNINAVSQNLTALEQVVAKKFNVDVNTKEGKEKVEEFKKEAEKKKIQFNADPETFLEELYKIVNEKHETTVEINGESANAEQETEKLIKSINKSHGTVDIYTDTEPAQNGVNVLKKWVNGLTASLKVVLASDSLSTIKEKITSNFANSPVPVWVNPLLNNNYKVGNHASSYLGGKGIGGAYGSFTGGAHAYGNVVGSAFAKGTLVGEIGEELVVDPNKGIYYTVGSNGAEFIDMPRNGIVFNHKQTEELRKNGSISSRGEIHNFDESAFAYGNITGKAFAASNESFGGRSNGSTGSATKKNTKTNISDGASATNDSNKAASASKKAASASKKAAESSASAAKSASEATSEISTKLSEAFGKFFDWTEVKLASLEQKMSLYEAKAENYNSYQNKNKMVENQISTLVKTIDADKKASKAYLTQANKAIAIGNKYLTSAQKKEVSSAVKIIKAGGAIKFSSYSDEAKTVIEQYKTWYDSAQELNVTLEENKAKLQELAATKLTNIQNAYSNRTSYYDGYISASEAKVSWIQGKSNHALSTSSYKNTAHYDEMKNAYKSIISNTIKNEGLLAEERNKLQSQLNSEVKKGRIKKYSDVWYEWQNNINSLTQEIYSARQQTEEYYQTLYHLPLEKAAQAVEKLNEQLFILEKKGTVMSGGSNVYDKVVTANAKTEMNARKNDADQAKKDRTKEGNDVLKTLKTVKSSKLSSSKKKAIENTVKNGKIISTSGLTGNLLTQVKQYNEAVQEYSLENSKYASAKKRYDTALSTQKSNSSKSTATILNGILDSEVANLKKQNNDYQAALRSANINVLSTKNQKTTAQNNVTKAGSALLKYKLSTSQKKAIKNGDKVSTSGLTGKALTAANNYNNAVAKLTTATVKYNATVAAQTEALNNATTAELDYAEKLQTVAKEAFDNVAKEFDGMVSKISSDISLLEAKLEHAVDFDLSKNTQKELMESTLSSTQSQTKKYYDAVTAAQKEYNKRKGNMTDEDRLAAQEELNSLWGDYYKSLSAEKDVLEQILELNNKITFDDRIDDLEYVTSELEHLRTLNSGVSFIDDKGALTSAGQAEVALIADAIRNAQEEVAIYTEKMEVLNKAYKSGVLNEEEYKEQTQECRDAIYENAEAVHSFKNELVELYKEQMDKELEALNEIIDKRSKALQSMKEYHDYADGIKTQSKDLQSLQAQIAALEGVDDAASKAKLAELRAQLSEGQEALDKTVDDHRFDVLNQGLNDLSESAQETYDEMIKDIERSAEVQESIVNRMLNSIKTAYKDTYAQIKEIVNSFELEVTTSTTSKINELKSATGANTKANEALSSQTSVNKNELKDTINEFIANLSKTTRTKDQLNNSSSDLYGYVGLKYGKNLTRSDMIHLGRLLGVTGLPANPLELQNSKKTEILKAFKKAGFSNGGVIDEGHTFTPISSIFDVIKKNGDNSLVVGARAGESIMTEKFTSMLPNLLKNIELFNGTFDAMKDKNLSVVGNSSTPTQIVFDSLIHVDGNVDKEFMPDLQKLTEQAIDKITSYYTRESKKLGIC